MGDLFQMRKNSSSQFSRLKSDRLISNHAFTHGFITHLSNKKKPKKITNKFLIKKKKTKICCGSSSPLQKLKN